MPTFSERQNKPSPAKNFFQNYSDHINCLVDDKKKVIDSLKKDKSNWFEVFYDELKSQLTMFDAMRDRYDYFDEVMGATLLPIAGVMTSMTLLSMSIIFGVASLFSGNKRQSDFAKVALFGSVAAYLFAMATFLKSAISLISRPIVTALDGWKKQDTVRFFDNNTVWSSASKKIEEMFAAPSLI